jgi:hypothetical protein
VDDSRDDAGAAERTADEFRNGQSPARAARRRARSTSSGDIGTPRLRVRKPSVAVSSGRCSPAERAVVMRRQIRETHNT